MSVMEIIKGAEFKIAVNEEVGEDDIFINEYRRAAFMMDEIVGASIKDSDNSWLQKQQDFENNIIAFCGERGEGKSSAMMTFVNAMYEYGRKENKKNIFFSEPIIIDPSLFDDVHNVLDIVLAKIFKNFYTMYNSDNQCVDEMTRERLLDKFQKVYRYISLINNQQQMLDDEYDYDGNIIKLTKLGESTKLKEEFSELVAEYLKLIDRDNENHKRNHQLIIAIDDLDLCSSNAYKMAEQIRKYLIIPHVIIVMSVRIEQLELCIVEKNLEDFKEINRNMDINISRQLYKEAQIMAERYVAKLIPKQRRIYLPKVQSFYDIQIIYKERRGGNIIWDSNSLHNSQKSLTAVMLDLIYEKTGMHFLPEEDGRSYLLPDNLRDMVSWIVLLASLKEANGESNIYLENIKKFEQYFQKEWMGDRPYIYDDLSLQEIGNMDSFYFHVTVRGILSNIYIRINNTFNPQLESNMVDRPDSFFLVIRLFDILSKSVIDRNDKSYIYRLRTLYTIKINSLLQSNQKDKIMQFIGGYIWGASFSNIIPSHSVSGIDRSRFLIGTVDCFNRILEEINWDAEKLPISEFGKSYRIAHITKGIYRDDYIRAWIVLGLLYNINYTNNINQYVYASNPILIFDNNILQNSIYISLENYLVALCNLESLYDKVNMMRLGIQYEEFKRIADELQNKNRKSIECAKRIVFNVDLLLGLKDYCMKNREYKESTESETDRSTKLVDVFFKNIADYLEQCGIENDGKIFKLFSLGDDESYIDISVLYADLFDLGVQNNQLQRQLEENKIIGDIVAGFRKKITSIPENWNNEKVHVSKALRNRSASNVKYNLDNLATRIEAYIGHNWSSPQGLDVDGLCNLYSSVVGIYMKDKNAEISKELYEDYKRLVKVQYES